MNYTPSITRIVLHLLSTKGPRNTRQLSEEIPNYTEKLRSVSYLKKGILNGMKANNLIIKKYSHEEKDYLWYINNEKVKSENYRELKTPEEVKRIVEARIKEREYLDIKNPRKISLENIVAHENNNNNDYKKDKINDNKISKYNNNNNKKDKNIFSLLSSPLSFFTNKQFENTKFSRDDEKRKQLVGGGDVGGGEGETSIIGLEDDDELIIKSGKELDKEIKEEKKLLKRQERYNRDRNKPKNDTNTTTKTNNTRAKSRAKNRSNN